MIKTVSLPTAKLLKEAGFRQDTEINVNVVGGFNHPENMLATPTTDELLEELPERYNKGWLTCQKVGLWEVGYESGGTTDLSFEDESLPEALAQMWLWLKKEGLLAERSKNE